MPNGDALNEQLEFERNIKDMSDRQLLEVAARQIYSIRELCPLHDKRIKALEESTRRMAGVTGGISGTITGIIVGLISYFTGK